MKLDKDKLQGYQAEKQYSGSIARKDIFPNGNKIQSPAGLKHAWFVSCC
jgi:hypothetical protein